MKFKPKSPGWELIPAHMRGAMDRYICSGIPPGGFLEAVLFNDLTGAVAKADQINRHRLVDIVQFLMWHAPADCWGSREAVQEWIRNGGLDGQKQERTENAGSPDPFGFINSRTW